jgi:hypothetical protein
VIACLTSMTSGIDEPGRYIPAAEGYEEHVSLRRLSDVERALRHVLADDESTLAAFFETALEFLGLRRCAPGVQWRHRTKSLRQ